MNNLVEKHRYCPNCKAMKSMTERIVTKYMIYKCKSCDQEYQLEMDSYEYRLFHYKSERINTQMLINSCAIKSENNKSCKCVNSSNIKVTYNEVEGFIYKCGKCKTTIIDPDIKTGIDSLNSLKRQYPDFVSKDLLYNLMMIELFSQNFKTSNEIVLKYAEVIDLYDYVDEEDVGEINRKTRFLKNLLQNEVDKREINIKKNAKKKKTIKTLIATIMFFIILIGSFFGIYFVNSELLSFMLPKHTVTIVLPDSDTPIEIKVVKGTKINKINSKLDIDKIIENYSLNESLDEIFNGRITKDTTLYVVSFIKNTITLKSDDQVIDTLSYEVGETVSLPVPEIEKTGYEFKGWIYNGEIINSIVVPNENITLQASWGYESYTATFMANGEQVDVKTFTLEDSVISDEPSVPSKTGYTGVWENYEIIANNITINAVYTAINYTATFKADGTEVAQKTFTIEDVKVNNEPSVPEKTGYLGEWQDYIIKAENITINAEYVARNYAINYNLNNGTNNAGNKSSYTIESETITLLNPTRDDSLFIGWYNNENFDGEKITSIESGSTGEVNLYARFKNFVETTEDGYFVIMLKEDLLYFSQNYITYTKARMFDNIDLGEMEWTPIGNEDTPYTGTFDGNNYKITNLKITTNRAYNGLFGYCDYVTINNLNLENVKIEHNCTLDGSAMGGMIGYAQGSSTIKNSSLKNCTIKITSTDSVNSLSVGGMVGYTNGPTTIENSYFETGELVAESKTYCNVGGFVGETASGNIINSYVINLSNICAKSRELTAGAGGFAGYVSSGSKTMKIENSNVTESKINAFGVKYAYAGGLLGSSSNSVNIKKSFVNVEVNSEDYEYNPNKVAFYSYAGGFIGEVNQNLIIQNSYSVGKINASSISGQLCESSAGGLLGINKNASSITFENCYSTSDIKIQIGYSSNNSTYCGAGGLLGGSFDAEVTIANCYTTGSITTGDFNMHTNKKYFGGLIGRVSGELNISNSYKYNGQQIESDSSCIVDTNGISTDLANIWVFVMNNWDSSIWNLSSSNHPTLKMETES